MAGVSVDDVAVNGGYCIGIVGGGDVVGGVLLVCVLTLVW